MKKILIAFMAISVLALAACGSYNSYSESKAAPQEAPAPMAKETAYEEYDSGFYAAAADSANTAGGSSARAYNGDVKLIYRASISAQTTDIESAAAEIDQLAAGFGGYIEYSDMYNNTYGSEVYRYATCTVRVPGEQYEAFLAAFGSSGNCTVTGLSKSVEDVGAEYADTEARLETYRIKQERLQELLKEAETMEDIITIENALTDVEYEIENYSSTLNRYDALINFSTISISLEQVARESQTTASTSLGDRISSSFQNGIAGFATGFENFLVVGAGLVIPLLITAGIVVATIFILRAVLKKYGGKDQKKKEKKEKKKEPEKDNDVK